ncbi:MAG: DegT/DnrJ/EryC1/StrS family aminotransferase [Bacteroidetes bacterium]|nr:DegT/DnrJ/EryC1/StrS family aminotransferase [Bacteroidota bacterium]
MSVAPFLSLDYQHRSIERELKQAFYRTLERGKFILGKEVDHFEKEFAAYHKSKYCISVANGHDALLISLKALGIDKGDEVIVPSHTCQATWLAVMNAGAKPVPVEVDPSTYTIDSLLIENSLTRKTKAIIPVHLYGHPCEMDKIMAIAKKNNLFVIEDNAQAHGATFKNKMTGSWGHCNATSFYPTKNLGALGDGGAIITSNKKLCDFARAFRNYGSEKKDVHSIPGVNSRLDELQAAILQIKLRMLDEWNETRRRTSNLYFGLLQNIGDIQLPPRENRETKPVYHQFVIQTSLREKLQAFLSKKGIETAVHYPIPIHLQKTYSYLRYKKGNLPVAERLAGKVLSLPVWPGLKKDQVEIVCSAVRKFFA